ncbi:MAG: TIGR04283 family arsenosugar biosynthesis glycosyltransferase [Hyphomonadaceae bacterium]
MSGGQLSVIIPALNAARHLPQTFAPLVRGVAEGLLKEVIIADGGSTDQTLAMADAAGCYIVHSERGRAKQLRAGAAEARGRWLLFLHADTVLASGWVEETQRFIAAPEARKRAAAFRLAFDDRSRAARRVVFWARLRAQVMKLPYGDQGLLISRFLYDGLGGYTDMPLMEDVDMVRRIGPKRLSLLETEAVTSADKYRRDGYDKRAWRNLSLMARYFMGADPVELAKAYD